MDTAFESPLKYVSKSLLNNMEFAKKVAKKCGFALKFFFARDRKRHRIKENSITIWF